MIHAGPTNACQNSSQTKYKWNYLNCGESSYSSIIRVEHPAQPRVSDSQLHQLRRVSYTLAKWATLARKLLASFLCSNQKEWSNQASHLLKNFYSEAQITWLPIHMGFTCEKGRKALFKGAR